MLYFIMYFTDGREERRYYVKRGLQFSIFFGPLWSVFPLSGFVFYVNLTCAISKNAKIGD